MSCALLVISYLCIDLTYSRYLQSEAASTEIQPPLPDSVANQLPLFCCYRVDQQPVKHNGQLGATVEQHIGVETSGAASGHHGLLDLGRETWDLGLGRTWASGLGDLGSWRGGELGIERAAEASCNMYSCQKLHNIL